MHFFFPWCAFYKSSELKIDKCFGHYHFIHFFSFDKLHSHKYVYLYSWFIPTFLKTHNFLYGTECSNITPPLLHKYEVEGVKFYCRTSFFYILFYNLIDILKKLPYFELLETYIDMFIHKLPHVPRQYILCTVHFDYHIRTLLTMPSNIYIIE